MPGAHGPTGPGLDPCGGKMAVFPASSIGIARAKRAVFGELALLSVIIGAVSVHPCFCGSMPEMKLKFEGGDVALKDGVTTLGRTTENDVSFPGDTNVSRYHAEIEARGADYCLIDLGSSNGTTVNGDKVAGEVYLKPGDRIVLGGSSEVIFSPGEDAEPEKEIEETAVIAGGPSIPSPAPSAPPLASVPDPTASGSRMMLMVAGGAVLIALIVVVAAGAIYYRSTTTSCEAKVKIVTPENFEAINKATQIELDLADDGCVAKAVFTIGEEEIGVASESPFTATLDPDRYPRLADGEEHELKVVLLDDKGKNIAQAGALVSLDTRKAAKPVDERPPADDPAPQPPVAVPGGKEVSPVDLQRMTVQLARQFPGNGSLPSKQVLADVQKKTGEFAKEGYFERAAVHRDTINLAFVQVNNLPAPYGFLFAMSRSGFDPRGNGQGEGLWRMSPQLKASQNFGGDCGTESMSDPKQACAARAAAAYLKELLIACGNDALCAAAAFGKSPQEAIIWKAGLPNKGVDMWNSLPAGPEREQLVRFFAASVVAENPHKFGLKRDKPISALYP